MPAKKQYTYEDLCKFPAETKVELVAGDLEFQPGASPRHQAGVAKLYRKTDSSYGDSDGWLFLADIDVVFGRDVFRPDLSGWRKGNWPDTASQPARVIPDFVCEVVSPNYRKYDRQVKRAAYEREGLRHYWILDPEMNMLETLKWVEGLYVSTNVFQRDDIVCAEPFPELKFELCDLFLF
jgi:Uma2 family endonuclease